LIPYLEKETSINDLANNTDCMVCVMVIRSVKNRVVCA
jgi:hypothetical protein